jgi:RNA polymerase sigma-70 factor, ECF subfamily
VSAYPEALRWCLGTLSETHRKLVLDRYQTGHSLADCASRHGRTENSLKVTLHRIRVALRRCISRRLQSEPT